MFGFFAVCRALRGTQQKICSVSDARGAFLHYSALRSRAELLSTDVKKLGLALMFAN
jgi:hypothetical protein